MSNRFYAGQKDYISKLNEMDDAGVRMGSSYYGSFSSAPSTRNDGSARVAGDRYFDTTLVAERTWNGTTWYTPNIDTAALALSSGAAGIGSANGSTVQSRLDTPVFTAIAKATKNGAIFTEYANTTTGNGTVKVAVGMLGNPEANISVNMDYTTNVHKYYDSSKSAMWFAMGPENFAMQYAVSGASAGVDCWTAGGSLYLWGGTSDGRFFINSYLGDTTGTALLYLRRNSGKASIGGDGDLVIEGSKVLGTSAPVQINAYNAGNVLLAVGGGKVSVGATSPINTLEVATATSTGVNGSDGMAVTDGASSGRMGLNFGANTAGAYGYIQVSKGGVGYKDLSVQPNGGSVIFGASSSSASAKVAIESTTQGFLLPRMTTTQKNAIASPANGLVLFDTTLGKMCVVEGGAWKTVTTT